MTQRNPAIRNQNKVKAFARSAALTVEAVKCINGMPTVNIEVAKKSAGGDGYNWGQKLIVQPSESELLDIVALFVGEIDNLKIQRPDQSIELIRQDGNYFLRASRRSILAMPVTYSDGFRVFMLVLNQLCIRTGYEPHFMTEMISAVYGRSRNT